MNFIVPIDVSALKSGAIYRNVAMTFVLNSSKINQKNHEMNQYS
jgi:hypothetical protein